MAKLNIGGVVEDVITSEEFTLDKAREVLKNEVVAVIGYGVQGRGQALNMKDNGINVIVGEGDYNWQKAIDEGFVPGKTLFPPLEAAARGTIIQYLQSDAGQKAMWTELKPLLTAGKALYFSHGFSIVYKEQTGVIPPPDIDVILVAPKGAGRTVRDNFLAGSGINSSYAVFQDATGRALERTLATGKTHFWSRSRQKYWMKGESSGHTQTVKSVSFDCDGDTLLIQVEQIGAACHEGYQSCFFRTVQSDGVTSRVTEPRLQTPEQIYGAKP